jgi:hypothetical protein
LGTPRVEDDAELRAVTVALLEDGMLTRFECESTEAALATMLLRESDVGKRIVRPSAKVHKPVSALPPQMGIVLILPVFSSVARALLSHGLVVGKHRQNTLVRLLVHGSRLERHGITQSPFQPSTQFLDTTRRAVPPVAHGRLIGDTRTFAAGKKPNLVIASVVASIQDARGTLALATEEYQVSTAVMGVAPVTTDDLPNGVQWRTADGLTRKMQYQSLCIRPTGHLKPNGSEQPTLGAKFQLPLAGQFMDVKSRTLHVAKLAF